MSLHTYMHMWSLICNSQPTFLRCRAMRAWAQGPGAGDEGARASKVRAVGGDDKYKQMATLAAKLSLHNAQEIKPLNAAAGTTIIFQEEKFKQMCDSTKKAGKNYAEKARLQTGGKSNEGPPHVHIYAAMVLSIVDMAPEGAKQVLQKHVETVTDPRELVPVLKRCQVTSCRESGKMKLRLHMVDLPEHTMKKVQLLIARSAQGNAVVEDIMGGGEAGGPLPTIIQRAIEEVFKAHGGEVAEGFAPRGGLERELQKMLDDMKPTAS